jgi:hypothetical protein
VMRCMVSAVPFESVRRGIWRPYRSLVRDILNL